MNKQQLTTVAKHLLRGRTILLLALIVMTLAACNRGNEPEASAGEPDVATVAPPAAESDASSDSVPAVAAEVGTDAQAEATPVAEPTAAAAIEPTPTPVYDRGNVVLWHAYGRADGDALAQVLANLAAQYPDLTVDTLFVAYDDLPQAYADAVLAGGGPDLIAAPTWWLNEMIAGETLQPLGDLLDPAVTEAYWPAALENLERDGQLYGLPLSYELVSLFVNTELAPAHEAPLTTGEMLKIAESAPEKGAGIYANLYHLAWGLPAYGGELIDEQGVIVLDQGSGAADFLEWLNAMQDAPGTFVDLDYGMLMDRFKKGEFAYFVDGPWAIDELRGALGENLAVVALPAGPAGPTQPWLSAEGVMLNPTLDDAQTRRALLVAKGLTDADAGAIWASTARRLPAARNANMGDDPLLRGFQQQAANARPMPAQDEMAAVWGYAGDMIVKVLNEVMTPADAVVEASALINEENGK